MKLNSLFCESMVLQRDISIPVWGWAEPGEAIEVSLAGKTLKTKADASGSFRVAFAPLPAGGPHILSVRGAKDHLTSKNVMVGVVWVASGQSNMEWQVAMSQDGEAECASADHPQLRMFTVPKKAIMQPQADVEGVWEVCTPYTVGTFSAVGYFFARELQQRLGGIPVGIINTSWGGTLAEAWTSREGLLVEPELKHMIEDSDRAHQYCTLFPAMIRDWRRAWGLPAPAKAGAPGGDFAFHFVQLANYMPEQPKPGESAWAELREAQRLTLREPNTGMAVTLDIGDGADIHPTNKQDVGRRLAYSALVTVYGQPLAGSGPAPRDWESKDGVMRVRFDHTEGGLVTHDHGPVRGFAIAGANRIFHWAWARIEDDTVIVRHPHVPNPVAVRYAWADNPVFNLGNGAGLPATPFKTDDWPWTTQPK